MSLFRDTTEYLSTNYKSTEWKNHYTPLKFIGQLPLDKTGETSYGLDVFCCEEELAGYRLSAEIKTGSNISITDQVNFSLKKEGGPKLDDTEDESPYTSAGGGIHVNSASLNTANSSYWRFMPQYGDAAFAYPAPGIAVRWSENRPDGAAQTITWNDTFDTDSPITWMGNILIPEDFKLDKVFDGGTHCWIHPSNEDVGNAYVSYTDALPPEIFNKGNAILAFNYLKNRWQYNYLVQSNRAFTLGLWGSIDGSNWEQVDVIIDDLDLIQEDAAIDGGLGGASKYQHTYQGFFKFGIGINWERYSQYKLGWFIKDDTTLNVIETTMHNMNFCKLGIYSL